MRGGALTPVLAAVRDRLEAVLGVRYDSLLVNYYPGRLCSRRAGWYLNLKWPAGKGHGQPPPTPREAERSKQLSPRLLAPFYLLTTSLQTARAGCATTLTLYMACGTQTQRRSER